MDVRLPELGEGIVDATVVNVLARAGQAVTADQVTLVDASKSNWTPTGRSSDVSVAVPAAGRTATCAGVDVTRFSSTIPIEFASTIACRVTMDGEVKVVGAV